jgi:TetR/AcrR family transcriptional regulator
MDDRRLDSHQDDAPSESSVSARTAAKRDRMIEVALHAFAENGYQGARIEDMAAELGIAKGSFFQYFGSKEGLFFAAYRKAVSQLPAWLDAPEGVLDDGFFATLRYWLEETEHLMREDWIPSRVTLIGNYGTDLSLKREINRFLATDPYGTVTFVKYGLERKELRDDIDIDMIVSMVDWMMERFQDAAVADELDPGLFRRGGDSVERRTRRIDQFEELIRSAIGAQPAS